MTAITLKNIKFDLQNQKITGEFRNEHYAVPFEYCSEINRYIIFCPLTRRKTLVSQEDLETNMKNCAYKNPSNVLRLFCLLAGLDYTVYIKNNNKNELTAIYTSCYTTRTIFNVESVCHINRTAYKGEIISFEYSHDFGMIDEWRAIFRDNDNFALSLLHVVNDKNRDFVKFFMEFQSENVSCILNDFLEKEIAFDDFSKKEEFWDFHFKACLHEMCEWLSEHIYYNYIDKSWIEHYYEGGDIDTEAMYFEFTRILG